MTARKKLTDEEICEGSENGLIRVPIRSQRRVY